ncbi:hypothetical protein [Streptomyces sp. NPDC054765]
MLPVRDVLALPGQTGPKAAGLCHATDETLTGAYDAPGVVSRTVVVRPDAFHGASGADAADERP